jgi:hypothetical protein
VTEPHLKPQHTGHSLIHPGISRATCQLADKILAKPNLTIGNAVIYCAPVVPNTVMV